MTLHHRAALAAVAGAAAMMLVVSCGRGADDTVLAPAGSDGGRDGDADPDPYAYVDSALQPGCFYDDMLRATAYVVEDGGAGRTVGVEIDFGQSGVVLSHVQGATLIDVPPGLNYARLLFAFPDGVTEGSASAATSCTSYPGGATWLDMSVTLSDASASASVWTSGF